MSVIAACVFLLLLLVIVFPTNIFVIKKDVLLFAGDFDFIEIFL